MPYVGQKPADIISTAVDTVTGKFSGEVDAASLDISGNIDVDGVTNLDVTDIDGTLNVAGETTLQTHLKLGDDDKIKLGDSGDLEVYHDGSNSIIIDGGTGDLKLRSNGTNVDIGNANGEVGLRYVSDGTVELYHDNTKKLSTEGSGIQILGATNDVARIAFGDSDDVDIGFISYNNGDNHMQFGTNTTERLRILSDGRIGHGATAAISGAHFTQTINSANGAGFNLNSVDASGQMHSQIIFRRNGSNVGSIDTNGSSTQFSTSSDYRLKENVTTSWDATSRLKQLKPSRFNFKIDADTTVDGFLAHEVSSIVPEAITGTKDGTEDITNVILNADGTVNSDGVSQSDWTAGKSDETYASDTTWVASKTIPKYQAIDQSKIVPLLTKALQEQQATIEALTARIVTLENA